MTTPTAGRRWTDTAQRYLSRTTPVVPPIYQSATFELDDRSYRDMLESGGFEETHYTRFANPTVSWAADGVARLEGAPAAVMTSSGMGAIATTLVSLCRAGDRIVAARELYGDTHDLLARDLPALALGADVVVHSATKFLNGHSDVVAGAVVADPATVREVRRRMVTFGTCLDPHAAFLVARALHTYELRLGRQAETAAAIAGWLDGHAEVDEVAYPGLASHPDAAVADRTWRPGRRGAMVAFVVAGGDERAARFLRALDLVREATSLGGVETLISAPHSSSQFSYTAEELELAGIRPGMVRLSVGLEDPAELLVDLDQALGRTRITRSG